jgi:hypothetical protein
MFIAVVDESFETVSEELHKDIIQLPEIDLKFLFNPIINVLFTRSLNENKTKLEYKKTLVTNIDSFNYNHGDEEILKELRKYQIEEEINELTYEDVKKALGKKATGDIVRRIMDRFDKNGDGTIDLNETLADDDIENEEDEVKKDKYTKMKIASLKSIDIDWTPDDSNKLIKETLENKIQFLEAQLCDISSLVESIKEINNIN